MKIKIIEILLFSAILTVGLTMGACSNKGDLLKEISGQWQDDQSSNTVVIHLADDNKTITVNGQTYPVTVDKIEMINYMVSLIVQNGGSEPELWTIRQMWDESGGSFKLAFIHSGKNEMLVSKQQS
jgi:hypothetical protein